MGFNLKNVTAIDMSQYGIRVYIASAYTIGDCAVNVRKSIDAYNDLAELGFFPFAPLMSHFIHMVHPRNYESWMRIDFKWLEVCDCLLRLPGESSGADREIDHAEKLGIPVFYSIADLVAYYKNKIQKQIKK